jgi:uncharacterized protein YycO
MSAASTQNKTQAPAAAARIASQSLEAGDIIATRSDTLNSAGTQVATGSPVSHAILYTGGTKGTQWAVDAMPKQGVTRDLLNIKLKQASYAVVFRHRTAAPEQCARACAWAEVQALVHKPYDYKSAARVGIVPYTAVGRLIIIADEIDAKLNPEGEDASFMCSELVFRAYEIAGAPLTHKPAYCMSPYSLFHTDRLACLGRLA